MEARLLKSINYLWRLIATAITFFVFGLGSLFIAFIVFPLINLVVRDEQTRIRRARKINHLVFRMLLKMMSFFGMFDFDFEDVQRKLKNFRGKIIAANHPSLIDVVILIAILPNVDCIVKEALWNNFFLKGAVKAAGYIKNKQDVNEILESCKGSLDSGGCIIIFPEGTRSGVDEKIKLQRGASNIAIRCNADIVTVIICCYPRTLTKNEPWYSIPKEKSHFSLHLGKIIKVQEFNALNASLASQSRALTAYMRDYFSEEIKKHA